MNKALILGVIYFLPSFVNASGPSITLRYSMVFDSWCAKQTGVEIKPSEQEKLSSIFGELQAEWDRNGLQLLGATEKLFKKPFLQKEMIGIVFLCKKTPSMSLPLMINSNWFVSESPTPTDRVTDIIYHELIHTYLVDNFTNILSSPMLNKYKSEESGVLAHLHLMAIQKKVYLSLGLKERIEKVIKFDSESYKGAYKRAWEIVSLEGEDKFTEELK